MRTKTASLFLLATLTLTSALCAQDAEKVGEKDAAAASVKSATWKLTYTWDGHGPGTTLVTFYGDGGPGGTFRTSDGSKGRWFWKPVNPPCLVFAFEGQGSPPAWSSIYSATFRNGAYTGIQGWVHTSGRPIGIHSMVRHSQFVEDEKELSALHAEKSAVSASGVELSE